MNGFEAPTLQTDITAFKTMFRDFTKSIPAEAWGQRTGSRDRDWTLHETVAHLVSIANLFNRTADAAINNHRLLTIGLSRREDLRNWNNAEIEARKSRPHYALIAELMAEYDRTSAWLETVSHEQLEQTTFLRVYNRPARAIDFMAWQLSHAGIIHAAQMAYPVDSPPLWSQYPDDMLWRQVDRYMRHFSVAYWQAYGPDHAEAINMHIGDHSWHLIAAPGGGDVGQGALDDARHTLHFDRPQTLFGIFTFHLPMKAALANGQMQVDGDVRKTMGLLRLFSPSPPK